MSSPFLRRLSERPWLLAVLAALLYGGLHLLWYWQTPLGVAPVLDEKENLTLARTIAEGRLSPEPFYRAMGYPLLLSVFHHLQAPSASLPLLATGLGLLLHVANTLIVAKLAARLFRDSSAETIAALLHALNPVLIHYATQILDGTLANTFFLAGLLALFRRDGAETETAQPAAIRSALGAALAWSLAALVRPQFLILVPAFPAAWFLLRRAPLRCHVAPLAAAALAAFVPWLVLGIAQKHISGEFRLLPTQGPYNLWAANRPGAHGRYFAQSVHLPAGGDHLNPTEQEARLLFERETGRESASIDQINIHWRGRLIQAIHDDPIGWLGRLLRKTYYLVNDFDAYNNKTYSFHKARSPWLALNPLGWGVLFALASAGLVVLAARRPRHAAALGIICLFVAAGIVLTFVSGRFRLPLAGVLCVLGGGSFRASWLSPRARLLAATAAALAAAVAFSRFAGVHDTATYLQDELLVAASATEAGDDSAAWRASGSALALAPRHPDALAWRVTAGFNLLTNEQLQLDQIPEWTTAAGRLVSELPAQQPPPAVVAIAGLALWRDGERERAIALWKNRWLDHGETASRAALLLAGQNPMESEIPPAAHFAPSVFDTLLAARTSPRPDEQQRLLQRLASHLFDAP